MRDHVSRDWLAEILDDTEEQIDYLDTQLGRIDQLGIQNFRRSAMGDSDS